MWNVIEMGGGFVPVVGTILDFKAAWSGRSLAGRKLGFKERLVSFGFGCVGFVADVFTFVGGVGLGLRYGIGFLKGGKRAVKAGKVMKAMHEAGMARKSQSVLSKIGMWVGRKFNKAARLESATASRITSKAYDQARLMSKYKIADLAHAEKELASVRHATKKAHLKQLVALMKSTEKYRYDYMKALRGSLEGILKTPGKIGAAGRTWLRVKSAFHKVKEALIGLKIDPKIINRYEKTFDKIKALESERAQTVEELAELANKGKYFEKGEAAGKAGAAATELEHLEKLAHQQRLLAKSRKASLKAGDRVSKKYKDVDEIQDLFDKAKEGKKITKRDIRRAVGKAQDQGYKKASVKEITNAVDSYKDANLSLAKMKKIRDQRKADFDKAVKYEGSTREIIKKKREIQAINKKIATLHNERFIMQTEMMYKAERAMDVAHQWRRAIRFLQYGLVAGGVAFLTSLAPDKAVKAGYTVVGKTAVVSYKVGKKVFWDEHGGRPPMDKMIEERLNRGKLSYKVRKMKKKALAGKKPNPNALRDDTGKQATHD